MFHKKWDAAEDELNNAMAAADDMKVPVGGVLLLLGTVYSRTARVTFAEGVFREAVKFYGLDPQKPKPASSKQCVHPSLAAALCWRYCQLLSALPNRSTEAAAWADMAWKLWKKSGAVAKAGVIEEVLGDAENLKGLGQAGRGAVVSLTARRLLPLFPPQPEDDGIYE
eukprot:jgi/Chrzof1/8581/Cz03g16090.t1